MRISKFGGLIAAASKKVARPMLRIGAIPIIRRIVISFQQAGVFPIVVIAGADEAEIRYELSQYGVVFLSYEQPEQAQMLDAVKVGLGYLEGKCDRVAFVPVNVPMFTPDTLARLMRTEGDVVTPVCRGVGGHPVLLSQRVIPEILNYGGADGLRGALHALEDRRVRLPVEDEGIFADASNEARLRARLDAHNSAILHPVIQMSIERETPFFNARLKLLLFLIGDTRNVRAAAAAMSLSYGKAWDMLNRLEAELGYPVVERRQGGARGGGTALTRRGEDFLLACQRLEEEVFAFTRSRFQELFLSGGLL